MRRRKRGGDGSATPGADGATEAATTEGAAPVVGGILREGYDRDVSRLDPVNTTWWDASLFPAVHETVVTQDVEGNFIPMLAESWEASADGTEITFKIRDGLTFQSGAPCDAAAVATALNVVRKGADQRRVLDAGRGRDCRRRQHSRREDGPSLRRSSLRSQLGLLGDLRQQGAGGAWRQVRRHGMRRDRAVHADGARARKPLHRGPLGRVPGLGERWSPSISRNGSSPTAGAAQ